jgi:hypothetical protein
MTERILLDDSVRYEDEGVGKTFIVYPPTTAKVTPDTLALELSYSPIAVQGVIVQEEKHYPDGRIEVIQSYSFAPDILYALFVHLREVDEELS